MILIFEHFSVVYFVNISSNTILTYIIPRDVSCLKTSGTLPRSVNITNSISPVP